MFCISAANKTGFYSFYLTMWLLSSQNNRTENKNFRYLFKRLCVQIKMTIYCSYESNFELNVLYDPLLNCNRLKTMFTTLIYANLCILPIHINTHYPFYNWEFLQFVLILVIHIFITEKMCIIKIDCDILLILCGFLCNFEYRPPTISFTSLCLVILGTN